MFFLIGAEESAPLSLSDRIRRALTNSGGYTVRDTVVLGIRMRSLTIETAAGTTRRALRRTISRAVEQMRRERAGQVIFADAFPYKEFFLREGFEETAAGALTPALAGRIAVLAAGGGTTALLVAQRLTGCAVKALGELCAGFRHVMVLTQEGADPIFEALRRRTGVSVIAQPSAQQISRADAAVFFAAPSCNLVLTPACVAIEAKGGALRDVRGGKAVSGLSLRLRSADDASTPPGFSAERLYGAALSAGTLRPEDIVIREIKITGRAVADADKCGAPTAEETFKGSAT